MKNKGFTIVESLVAITVLVLVITGTASAIQTSISSYIFSKDQIIAFYLAQEGFEQVRNIRDENALVGRNWLTNLDPCLTSNGCYVDVLKPNPLPSSCGTNCPVINQNQNNGFYGYDEGQDWKPTVFNRRIVMQQINSREVSITVTIDWSKGVTARQFRAKENLLNWQQQ
ncbi:MAG: hypothetical protein A2544_01350 [Candidatus Zambryskibacteria bacterium RIFOXYD2_FULL_43_10]|uniref:Type II secretion system protein GspI C-terminal domain-containing protein n=1 Tax=Candidatus Zambryskibacteria bacterium RIFOXYD2_FULL_43_10 TaxID=1802782 RepID=A0A1G2V7N6_9BACT|nr:MAG: hypothetical protein A2544_01350 [Candidatus Zambryskibacteria bacterium RIFOXYD2_FULL_43_10]